MQEIAKLKNKEVIIESQYSKGDFCSSIFTRLKKDGTWCMILNLKQLNRYMEYKHFKMESIQHALNVIRPDAYMATVDLKDAFYSIAIHPDHQKYLKFYFHNQYCVFTSMPNGYGPAIRIFTKITKPPFSVLRQSGRAHLSHFCRLFLLTRGHIHVLSSKHTRHNFTIEKFRSYTSLPKIGAYTNTGNYLLRLYFKL